MLLLFLVSGFDNGAAELLILNYLIKLLSLGP